MSTSYFCFFIFSDTKVTVTVCNETFPQINGERHERSTVHLLAPVFTVKHRSNSPSRNGTGSGVGAGDKPELAKTLSSPAGIQLVANRTYASVDHVVSNDNSDKKTEVMRPTDAAIQRQDSNDQSSDDLASPRSDPSGFYSPGEITIIIIRLCYQLSLIAIL